MQKNVIKNTANRIFYKDAQLRSGRTVTFSAWDGTGVEIWIDQASTNVTDSGIYYYDFNTPNSDSYMLILATDGEDPQGSVLKVGTPSEEKAFYLRGDLAENVATNYTIYDESAVVLSAGAMANVSNGFYSVIVESFTKPWFLEVNELVDVS